MGFQCDIELGLKRNRIIIHFGNFGRFHNSFPSGNHILLGSVSWVYILITMHTSCLSSCHHIVFSDVFIYCVYNWRMETLKIKTIQGTAKLVGITVCMGGVITLALYKGPVLKLPICPHLYHHRNIPGHVSGGSTSWLKGCVLMITSNILWGLWLVLQVPNQIATYIIIFLIY